MDDMDDLLKQLDSATIFGKEEDDEKTTNEAKLHHVSVIPQQENEGEEALEWMQETIQEEETRGECIQTTREEEPMEEQTKQRETTAAEEETTKQEEEATAEEQEASMEWLIEVSNEENGMECRKQEEETIPTSQETTNNVTKDAEEEWKYEETTQVPPAETLETTTEQQEETMATTEEVDETDFIATTEHDKDDSMRMTEETSQELPTETKETTNEKEQVMPHSPMTTEQMEESKQEELTNEDHTIPSSTLIVSTISSTIDEDEKPTEDTREVPEPTEPTEQVVLMPPPAPARIVGSLVPAEAEEEEDSDSEEDEAPFVPHAPLQLNNAEEDEELEVDVSVAQSIQLEKKQLQAPPLPPQEVRVAAVVQPHEESSEMTFGISYQDLRKKNSMEKPASYSLPKAPAFPDEREFENEVAIDPTAAFSTRAVEETDEFTMDTDKPVDLTQLQLGLVERERQAAEEEERVLEELRRMTEQERHANQTIEEETVEHEHDKQLVEALSLKELHSIYKRGFGDQEVLLLDENEAKQDQKPMERKLSLMEKVLSKQPVHTQVISEEEEEEVQEEEAQKPSRRRSSRHPERETLIDATRKLDPEEEEEASEWKEIALTHQPASAAPSRLSTAALTGISYEEASKFFRNDDSFFSLRDQIVPEDFVRTGPLACFSCLGAGRPRLTFLNAIEERDRVFCIAATRFDPSNDVYARILQTLYQKLMRTTRRMPLIGSHWEDIGFQGTDPSTDLRGCGVLSLWMLLFLVERHADVALRAHALSQHPLRHFPLCCALINVTLQCLVALRSGALYRECNKQSSVMGAMNTLFVALTRKLMDEIRTSSVEIPLVMKRVLDEGRVSPNKIIDEMENDRHEPKKPSQDMADMPAFSDVRDANEQEL